MQSFPRKSLEIVSFSPTVYLSAAISHQAALDTTDLIFHRHPCLVRLRLVRQPQILKKFGLDPNYPGSFRLPPSLLGNVLSLS